MEKNQENTTKSCISRSIAHDLEHSEVVFATAYADPPLLFESSKPPKKEEKTKENKETEISSEVTQKKASPTEIVDSPVVIQNKQEEKEQEEEPKDIITPDLIFAEAPTDPPSDEDSCGNGAAGGDSGGEDDDSPIQKKEGNTTAGAESSNDSGNLHGVNTKIKSSLSNVNIHKNSSKATEVGALAYTQGSDIHFAPGQFKPDTQSGKELIGHELHHVTQQKEGRVKANTEVNGMPVNDSPALEKEADDAGRKFAADGASQLHLDGQNFNSKSLQRKSHKGGCDCADCSGRIQMKSNSKSNSNQVIQRVPAGISGMTFCGVTIRRARGVNQAMRTALTNVQDDLQTKYDAIPESDPERPATLKDYAGVNTIKGYRSSRTSQHGTGNAVDVNYEEHPYIATRNGSGDSATYGGEGGGSTPATRALRRPAVEVYDRAVSFMETGEFGGAGAQVGARHTEESATHAYRRFKSVSDSLSDYLGLVFLDDDVSIHRVTVRNPETASLDDLETATEGERHPRDQALSNISRHRQNIHQQNYDLLNPWIEDESQSFYLQILRDYEIVRRPMQHGDPSTRPSDTRNPARGFLHFPEHFVVSMMDVGGMTWGACEFPGTANGDVHHFDLRTPTHIAPPIEEEATENVAQEKSNHENECGCAQCSGLQLKAEKSSHDKGCGCSECAGVQLKESHASNNSAPLQFYENENDPAVFQSQESFTNGPVNLLNQMRIFTLNDGDAPVTVDHNGQTLSFTFTWSDGHAGQAILRGRIRHEMLWLINNRGEDGERTVRNYITHLPNLNPRQAELEDFLAVALARRTDDGEERSTEEDDPNIVSPFLIEEGTQGRNMSRRGTLRDPEGWKNRYRERHPNATESQVEAALTRKENEIHTSMDVIGDSGTGVYAPIAGRVIWAGAGDAGSAGYGNLVKLIHENPPETNITGIRSLTTHYCHLSEVLVSESQSVFAGQAIGLVGNTRENARGRAGNVSGNMGNHLHFGVQIFENDEDPSTSVTTSGEVSNGINPAIWLSELGIGIDRVNGNRPDFSDNNRRGRLANPAAQQKKENPNNYVENINYKSYENENIIQRKKPIQRAEIPSGVNIHENSSKAKDVGALAYTQGSDIHFAPGQYNPGTQSGKELLGHELHHVKQQSDGRVEANTEVNGMPVNNNAGLEKEADDAGRKFAADNVSQQNTKDATPVSSHSNIIQKKDDDKKAPKDDGKVVSAKISVIVNNKSHHVKGDYNKIYKLYGDNPQAAHVKPEIPDKLKPTAVGKKDWAINFAVKLTKKMPVWDDLPEMKKKSKDKKNKYQKYYIRVVKEWGKFITSLGAHEDKHLEYDQKGFGGLGARLKGKTIDEAFAEYDKVIAELETEHNKFHLKDDSHIYELHYLQKEVEKVGQKKSDTSSIPGQLKSDIKSEEKKSTEIQKKKEPESKTTQEQRQPSNIIQKMEASFGTSFSDVNIHKNSTSAKENGALAYAQGTDVHFAPGQFKPDTKAGQELIGHELTHVVQQKQGRVKPTSQLKSGISVNNDQGLEKEADDMGAKVASSSSTKTFSDQTVSINSSQNILGNTIQRALEFDDTGSTTGNYEFVPGHGLSLRILNSIKEHVSDGNIITDTEIDEVRQLALRTRGSLTNGEQMLLAGVMNQQNVQTLNNHEAGTFTFPASSITDANREHVRNIAREEVPENLSEEETEQAIKDNAGNQFSNQADGLLAFAAEHAVDLSNILSAMITAASDSSSGDKVMAGICYAVAQQYGHASAGDLLNGNTMVDALVDSAFNRLISPDADGMYVTVGIDDRVKGDTLYLRTSLSISSLVDRALIIHELTHAREDVTAAAPAAPNFTSQVAEIEFEERAYRAQSKYILDQIADLTVDEQMPRIAEIAPMISIRPSGDIFAYAFTLETKSDEVKYMDIFLDIMTHRRAGISEENALNELARSVADLQTDLQAAIGALPMYGGGGGAGRQVNVDGAKGENIVDTIQRKEANESLSSSEGDSSKKDISIPENVNLHTNSSQASEMNALAFAQGNDIHFAPGQFKPDTKSGQELIGHELGHVQQQKEGRVKPTFQHKGNNINNESNLEKEADDYGAAFASSQQKNSSEPIQNKIEKGLQLSESPIQKQNGPIQKKDPEESKGKNASFVFDPYSYRKQPFGAELIQEQFIDRFINERGEGLSFAFSAEKSGSVQLAWFPAYLAAGFELSVGVDYMQDFTFLLGANASIFGRFGAGKSSKDGKKEVAVGIGASAGYSYQWEFSGSKAVAGSIYNFFVSLNNKILEDKNLSTEQKKELLIPTKDNEFLKAGPKKELEVIDTRGEGFLKGKVESGENKNEKSLEGEVNIGWGTSDVTHKDKQGDDAGVDRTSTETSFTANFNGNFEFNEKAVGLSIAYAETKVVGDPNVSMNGDFIDLVVTPSFTMSAATIHTFFGSWASKCSPLISKLIDMTSGVQGFGDVAVLKAAGMISDAVKQAQGVGKTILDVIKAEGDKTSSTYTIGLPFAWKYQMQEDNGVSEAAFQKFSVFAEITKSLGLSNEKLDDSFGVGGTIKLKVGGGIGDNSLYFIKQTYIDAPETNKGVKADWNKFKEGNKAEIATAIFNCVYNDGAGPGSNSSAGSSGAYMSLFSKIKKSDDPLTYCQSNATSLINDLEKCFDEDVEKRSKNSVKVRDFASLLADIKSDWFNDNTKFNKVFEMLKEQADEGGTSQVSEFLEMTASYGIDPIEIISIIGPYWGFRAELFFKKHGIAYRDFHQRTTETDFVQYDRLGGLMRTKLERAKFYEILNTFQYAQSDSNFDSALKSEKGATILKEKKYPFQSYNAVLYLIHSINENGGGFEKLMKDWNEYESIMNSKEQRGYLETVAIILNAGYAFKGGKTSEDPIQKSENAFKFFVNRSSEANGIVRDSGGTILGFNERECALIDDIFLAAAKNDLLGEALDKKSLTDSSIEKDPVVFVFNRVFSGIKTGIIIYTVDTVPGLGRSLEPLFKKHGINYKKGAPQKNENSSGGQDNNGKVAQPKMKSSGIKAFSIPMQLADKKSLPSSQSIQKKQNAKIPYGVNVHTESSQATEMGALAFAQGSDIHFAPGQFKPDTRSGQELIGHELHHVKQQKEGRVKPTIQQKGVNINNDSALEKEADSFGVKYADSLKPRNNNNVSQQKPNVGFSLNSNSTVQTKQDTKNIEPAYKSKNTNTPENGMAKDTAFSLSVNLVSQKSKGIVQDFSESQALNTSVSQRSTKEIQLAPDKDQPTTTTSGVSDKIPEADNQFYAHGSFMGAGIELMADPKWNYIFQKLMPDVHKDVTAAINKKKGSENVILMFENNPVTAAYGLARTQAKDTAVENGRSDRIEKLQAFEWDAFLSPDTIKKYSTAKTQAEKDRIAVELVDGLVIAHANTSQTIRENGPFGGLRQYDNVRETRKSGQGGVAAGAWMDLFGKAMIIGSDSNWRSKADEIGSKSRVDNKKDQTSDKTFTDKMSFSEVIQLYKDTYQKELFSVILDVKSRDTTTEVMTGLIQELNKRGVHVYGVGSFIDSELEGLRDVEQIIDGKKVASAMQVLFFHKAGDLQEACLGNKIAPGDTVMFNAGNLISYDRLSRGKNKKKSYKVKDEVVKQIDEYKKHYGFKLGVYVQENSIDDRAATLITNLTNDKPEIFDMGFAWGGVTGETAADIEPSLGSEKTGIGGQWIVGSEWDTEKDMPKSLTLKDAKAAIYKAGKWLGTDEEGIYDAIRNCKDRNGLKADPKIMAELRDEMSGHDLWKALLLLEYGSEAMFPAEITNIWNATKGWGTDEDLIYQTLQKLNATQIAVIKNIPGLRDILKDELSGDDLEASNDLLSGDYAKAIDNHKKDVAKMQKILKEMSKGTEIERNTAEWLNPDREGGAKNDLHVCTKTHDAKERAKTHNGKENYNAYFGANEIVPATGSYDAHIDSKRNIRLVQKNTGGHHLGKNIWMYDVRKNPAGTKIVMIHEVQHDADRHDKEAGHDKPNGSPEESWNRYKTEFRAYWVDGRYNKISSASDPKIKDFDNMRQKTIFDLLHGKSKTASLYPWLWDAYDKKVDVNGQKFDSLVHNYTEPKGINLKNSPRVDDFYNALDKCKTSDTVESTKIKTLYDAAQNLIYSEAYHIIYDKGSERIRTLMKKNLNSKAHSKVDAIIKSKVIGDFPIPKKGGPVLA